MTREEAKELLLHILMTYEPKDQYGDYDDTEPYEQALTMAIEALTERTKGEWIDEDGNNVPLHKDGYPLRSCYCNQCHEWLVASDEYEVKGNFCPSCGSRMKGGDSE